MGLGFDLSVTGGQIMIRAKDFRNSDQLKSVDAVILLPVPNLLIFIRVSRLSVWS